MAIDVAQAIESTIEVGEEEWMQAWGDVEWRTIDARLVRDARRDGVAVMKCKRSYEYTKVEDCNK